MNTPQVIYDSDVTNDNVDIYAEPKLKLKQIVSDDPDEFCIQMEGDCMDHSVSNAIRLTILKRIPIYGFNRHNIYIENEKSYHMYNNDMLYNQIESLVIFDIPNYFDVDDPEIFLPDDIMKEIFGKFLQQKNISVDAEMFHDNPQEKPDPNKKLYRIEFNLNTKNNTDEYKYVSTHDAVLKIDGKITNSYLKKDPIDIMVLKPNEEISLRAEANLGISLMDAAYEATTNVVSKEITSRKYEIIYETLGQLSANLIFQKACTILIKKLENLNTYIKKQYSTEPDRAEYVEFELYGEDHTISNLIATTLQKCDFVKEAGYIKPHPFVDSVTIKYKLKSKGKVGPIKVFRDTVTYLIKLFELIKKESLKIK